MDKMEKQKSRPAVFYTADEGYLFPTIASALLVRRKVAYEEAEIHIVLTNVGSELSDKVTEFLEKKQISVSRLVSSEYLSFDLRKFNKTHVPPSCLARFFMIDCAPGHYDRIIYLDGDTWAAGDIKPLIDYVPPAGSLAAAEGLSYFYRNDIGPTGDWTRKYFEGIGIGADDGYFNSGVLLADRSTWQTIAGEAFRYFIENIEACKYHDESALNAVAKHRRIRLSPKWNFVTGYWDWDAQNIVQPQILHFAGGFKPWTARIAPFERLYDEYDIIENEIGIVDLHRKKLDSASANKEARNSRYYKTKINTVFLHRLIQRRKQFRDICEVSVL